MLVDMCIREFDIHGIYTSRTLGHVASILYGAAPHCVRDTGAGGGSRSRVSSSSFGHPSAAGTERVTQELEGKSEWVENRGEPRASEPRVRARDGMAFARECGNAITRVIERVSGRGETCTCPLYAARSCHGLIDGDTEISGFHTPKRKIWPIWPRVECAWKKKQNNNLPQES